jgi:hypothetical protein
MGWMKTTQNRKGNDQNQKVGDYLTGGRVSKHDRKLDRKFQNALGREKCVKE